MFEARRSQNMWKYVENGLKYVKSLKAIKNVAPWMFVIRIPSIEGGGPIEQTYLLTVIYSK